MLRPPMALLAALNACLITACCFGLPSFGSGPPPPPLPAPAALPVIAPLPALPPAVLPDYLQRVEGSFGSIGLPIGWVPAPPWQPNAERWTDPNSERSVQVWSYDTGAPATVGTSPPTAGLPPGIHGMMTVGSFGPSGYAQSAAGLPGMRWDLGPVGGTGYSSPGQIFEWAYGSRRYFVVCVDLAPSAAYTCTESFETLRPR